MILIASSFWVSIVMHRLRHGLHHVSGPFRDFAGDHPSSRYRTRKLKGDFELAISIMTLRPAFSIFPSRVATVKSTLPSDYAPLRAGTVTA